MTNNTKREPGMQTPKASIRVSDAEWREWAEVAAATGRTRSELIREVVRSAVSVVRASQSANNATPGHFDFLSNAAQRSGSKKRSGGEAKGATNESPAKLGGLRSK